MASTVDSPDGWSIVPAAMESMSALSVADQKSVEPHAEQNP